MKIIHLSDLHLGKRVNEYSMLEDQKDILIKILNVIDEEHPDAVIIAGDVYDKSVPSAEAVELFDDFLVRLASRNLQVFIISGNHDSPERLAFGNRLMDVSGIHISPVYRGTVIPIPLTDAYGTVNFYLLPFVKPANVRPFFEDVSITSYTDAIACAISRMKVDPSQRNVLVTHQFVTGAERSESEEISVGGTDNVDVTVFDSFDYVALGHIHSPQNLGSERVRYCGTPLKYSFSESHHTKSVTIVELGEKGQLQVRTTPLLPKHDLVEIKGTYEDLMRKSYYDGTPLQESYVHVTLTDEEDIPDAIAKLRTVYHNLMRLDYDNQRTRHSSALVGTDDVERKSPLQLYSEFYEQQNGVSISEEQANFLTHMIENIWEEKS